MLLPELSEIFVSVMPPFKVKDQRVTCLIFFLASNMTMINQADRQCFSFYVVEKMVKISIHLSSLMEDYFGVY